MKNIQVFGRSDLDTRIRQCEDRHHQERDVGRQRMLQAVAHAHRVGRQRTHTAHIEPVVFVGEIVA